MEPADKPPVGKMSGRKRGEDETVIEFLPDADEIERRPLPRYARTAVHVLATMLVLFFVWSAVVEVDQVVTARGRLVTPLPNIVVQPLETSIIKSIDVRVGQVVKKGEQLATLDPTFTDADQAQLTLRHRSLATQVERLEAELSGAKPGQDGTDADARLQSQLSAERQANFRAQKLKMDESLGRLRASLDTNRRDQQVLAARVKSLQELEAMQEKLVAQQFGARMKLLEAQDKRLEVERDLQLTRNRELELKRELAALEAEKGAFDKGWRQKIMEDLLAVSRERDAVNEQLQKATMRHKLITLTAPTDAVVLNVAKLSQGSVIREAEQFFTLVPIGADLEAEVHIDSLDVGYVKAGDRARIKIDAFPFQKHGVLDGKVRAISEDAFRRENASAEGTDSYYVSYVSYGSSELKKMDGRSRLLPGMTVSAEIVVGKRTVLSYLVWPLTKGLDEAIREP